jgi:uncharacterized alkaline shock family protein YloU
VPDRTDEQAVTTQTAAQGTLRGVAPATTGRGLEATTPQGKTAIADNVVAKIAGIAAREIPGVHDLVTSGAGAAIAGLASRVTGGDTRSLGVSVEVGQQEAAVDLNMIVDYGVSIPQVAAAVRQNIINRVGAMTGLAVKEVNIAVTDLYFPEEQAARQSQPRVQ